MITKKDLKWFTYAEQISYLSDARNKHGCILVEGGNIRAIGYNSATKTSSLQHQYSHLRGFDPNKYKPFVHSEISLLGKLKHVDIDWNKAKIYVFRRNNKGEIANSRPCPACEAAIKDFGIKHVYYSNDDGSFTYERM